MSRFYSWRGDTLVRRPEQSTRGYTKAWAAARQRRSQRRAEAHLQEQPREDFGFLISYALEGVRLVDPGRIDRYLWVQAHQKEED